AATPKLTHYRLLTRVACRIVLLPFPYLVPVRKRFDDVISVAQVGPERTQVVSRPAIVLRQVEPYWPQHEAHLAPFESVQHALNLFGARVVGRGQKGHGGRVPQVEQK